MNVNDEKDEFDLSCDRLAAEEKAKLERADLTYSELLHHAAVMTVATDKMTELYIEAHGLLNEYTRKLESIVSLVGDRSEKLTNGITELSDLTKKAMTVAWVKGMQLQKKTQATSAANVRHAKPGGSREKARRVRELWASGKYSSRDICAEQECAGLNMSFSTARKALRKTPDPA